MKLDRAYQRRILEILAETAPTHKDAIKPLEALYFQDKEKYAVNILHMEQRKLIKGNVQISVDGMILAAFPPILLADGEDLLLNDGGIRQGIDAITVKLHQDSMTLLLSAIGQSQMADDQKSRLIESLKSLPSNALTSLATSGLGILVSYLAGQVGLPHMQIK